MAGIAGKERGEHALFALWLRRRRASLGLTSETLAELIASGCAAADVESWEDGSRRPTRHMAARLAVLFGVPASERSTFILFAISDLDSDASDASSQEDALDAGFDLDAPWRASAQPPSNLPIQLTTFVGREADVVSVTELIRYPVVRLLTLLGPPGIGKTRLSQEAARRLLKEGDFEDGVFFVSLAAVTEAAGVAPAVASVLGLKQATGKPPGDVVADFLHDKCLLLVLDNMEQIFEAGPVVTELLTSAPGVRILTTSRAALHVYGEQVWRVPPLPLPARDAELTAESLSKSEAADLFIQRARSARPDFMVDDQVAPTIAEICRRLDGLPLAIELAAARANVLSPQALLARLDSRLGLLTSGPQNLSPRQRTLRGAIEWSYNLLDDDEKAMYRRLSVFVGGFTLEAAEALATYEGTQSSTRDTLDLVSSLTDKSLLRQEEGPDRQVRFAMLETIREFGLECLYRSGEENEVRRAHAQSMLALAEEAEPNLTSAGRAPWLARLDRELDNLRAALTWSQTEDGDPELGLRLAGALHWYWYFRGHVTEGRKWLDETLAHADVGRNVQRRAKALYGAGRLAQSVGDNALAIPLLEEAAALSIAVGEDITLGYALTTLGLIQVTHGTASGALLCLRSVDFFRRVGDRWGLAYALASLADTDYLLGNNSAADRNYSESLGLYRELNDGWGVASALAEVGRTAMLHGDFEKARAMLEEALMLERLEGDRRSIAHSSRSLGMIAQQLGNTERAMKLYEESLALYREVGARQHISAALRSLGDLKQYQEDYRGAITFYQESMHVPTRSGDTGVLGLCCAGLARIASIHGEWVAAVQLFSAADTFARSIMAQYTVLLSYLEYERHFARARAMLSEAAFAEAWAAGKGMTQEQIDNRVQQLLFEIGSKEPDQAEVTPAARKADPTVDYPADLSRREVELLQLVALGLRNADIASRLFLSTNTVRAHLYNIYAKINVASRTAAARFATEHNLI